MYKIVKNSDNVYCIVVYSISALNPLKNIGDIEVDLSSMNIGTCYVLFDLLTSMGDTTKRYMEAEFKSGKFISNTLKSISNDKAKTLVCSSNSYLLDPAISSEFSVISRAGATIQKKGVV
jgi:hypothetical protein